VWPDWPYFRHFFTAKNHPMIWAQLFFNRPIFTLIRDNFVKIITLWSTKTSLAKSFYHVGRKFRRLWDYIGCFFCLQTSGRTARVRGKTGQSICLSYLHWIFLFKQPNRGSMLRSKYSAIFDIFRRKNGRFLKNQFYDYLFAKTAKKYYHPIF
jgi:hypothetical protein